MTAETINAIIQAILSVFTLVSQIVTLFTRLFRSGDDDFGWS